ncbi:hypothetical protein Nepgr_032793 [Nepenthes gracilis]|uniref:Uncharacterized protein n=1 Tax=Nepenthes gracilis TaxID=150966 RepID=A0AAD3TJB0_NEPGR|nr:hypothetical protein Nepgr_032793 [Nepenthes gracilis]
MILPVEDSRGTVGWSVRYEALGCLLPLYSARFSFLFCNEDVDMAMECCKQMFPINEMRVKAIQSADIIAGYVISLLIVYLTGNDDSSSSSNAIKLHYIKAAAVVNVFNGVVYMLPAGFSHLAEASVMAEFRILSFSSISYCMGLGLLVVAGSSDGMQNPAAFYIGLIFVAVGMAGQSTMAESFLEKQRGDLICGTCMRFILNVSAYLIVNMVGTLFQYFISNWKIKYAIATIFMVVATLIFLSGVCCCIYEYQRERRGLRIPSDLLSIPYA